VIQKETEIHDKEMLAVVRCLEVWSVKYGAEWAGVEWNYSRMDEV